jgi:long-chain fatty acid transport protein
MNRRPNHLSLVRLVALLLLLFLLPSTTLATDGMYLAGYGTEAMGRGGAGIAVADRALGLQFNPSGISQLQGNHFSLDLQVLMPSLHYNDAPPLSNDVDGANRSFYMPTFAYVRGGRETPWTWGIGLVSQGGMGATFVYDRTPFGTRDQTYSQVRFATLTPCVAYSINDNLSLGLSANIGWSDIVFRFWPDTSFYSGGPTPVAFFGPKLVDPASTLNYSFRLGAMWRVHPKVQIGAEYQNKTHSDYKGGTLGLNMSAIGLGEVLYDARVSGFTWPEQYGVGVQFRPAEKWVIALDVKRYNWSNAIDVIEVKGTNPNNPSAAAEVTLPFVFQWKDQTVYALGGEWRASDDVTVRAGYNYGNNPVPDDTLNPLFPAITEKHATVGLGWNHGASTLNFAVERTFGNTQTNNNPNSAVNPFGPGATVEHSQWTVAVGLTRAFGRQRAAKETR